MRRFNIDRSLLWRDHRPSASHKIDGAADLLFTHDVVKERRHHYGVFAGNYEAKGGAGAFVDRNIQRLQPLNEIRPAHVVLPFILKSSQHRTERSSPHGIIQRYDPFIFWIRYILPALRSLFWF